MQGPTLNGAGLIWLWFPVGRIRERRMGWHNLAIGRTTINTLLAATKRRRWEAANISAVHPRLLDAVVRGGGLSSSLED